MIASPDGRLAYVPIYGNSGVAKAGTDGTSMAVIDLASQKVISTVDFGHAVRPHCPIYDPVSKMLYVTTELDKSITIIDPKSFKIVGSIPTGEEFSHMLTIAHDGKRGYTANVKPGTVSVLDMKARKTLAVIPISDSTQRISISKDGPLGLHLRSDQAAACGDRHGDELGQDLGATAGARLWDRFDSRWPLCCWLRFLMPTRCRRRSDHAEGGEDDRRAQCSARGADAPRWSHCLRLLQRQEPGRRDRSFQLDRQDNHRRGKDRRRSRMGRSSRAAAARAKPEQLHPAEGLPDWIFYQGKSNLTGVWPVYLFRFCSNSRAQCPPYSLIAVAAYLLGSIPFGFLLVRVFRNEDIRTRGSGNIGATNVLRSVAKASASQPSCSMRSKDTWPSSSPA